MKNGFIAALVTGALGIASAANAQIVISQIMYDMAGSDTGLNAFGEFVEVYNPTGSDVDLSGWVIDDANSSYHTTANIASGIVPAGGVAYLFNADQISKATFVAGWGNCNAIEVSNWAAMSLNNGTESVALWDSFAAYDADKATRTATAEIVNYSDSAPWPDNNNQGSIVLNNLGADNNDGANWTILTGASITSITATGGTVRQANVVSGSWLGQEIASIVNLVGGQDPDITSPASATFGPIAPGNTEDFVITITNLGATQLLNVTAANFTGTGNSQFSIVGPLPTNIPADGGTGEVTVRYTPGPADDVSEAVLELTSNDAGSDIATVSLKGVAYLAPPVVISGIMPDNDGGDSPWEWVEIYNTSSTETVDLAGFMVDDINGTAFSSSPIATGEIGPGQTAYLINGDDITVAEFQEAWGAGVNAIAIAGWSNMVLNNGGDTVGLWNSFEAYTGDQATHAFAFQSITYEDASNNWPDYSGGEAIHLVDFSDNTQGTNWAVATSANLGGVTATGGTIRQSAISTGTAPNSGNEFASIKSIQLGAANWTSYE